MPCLSNGRYLIGNSVISRVTATFKKIIVLRVLMVFKNQY